MSTSKFNKILIFRNGQLGDTLNSVPALWVLRENFPNSEFTLLHDIHKNEDFIISREVLDGSGLIDKFISYKVFSSFGLILNTFEYIKLFFLLLFRNFDTLVYLSPSERTIKQAKRDEIFFKLTGVKTILGTKGLRDLDKKKFSSPLPILTKEAELLMSRLAKSGLKVPKKDMGRFDLALTEKELNSARNWIDNLNKGYDLNSYLALGIGSKMNSKKWPLENYIFVVESLIKKFDIYPIIFGGEEDRDLGQKAIEEWGRGVVSAGELRVRESLGVMSFCEFYLGNDTGTMHLAACAGIKCISLFSARDFPGAWYPYGKGHIQFRKTVPCEGCMLTDCRIEDLKCLRSISKEEVLEASCLLMSNKKNRLAST